GEPILGGGGVRLVAIRRGGLGARRRLSVSATADQLLVALLLLPGTALVPGGEAALDQAGKRLLHRGEVGELVEALTALLELARSLRPAQHQHGEQRDLGVAEGEGVAQQVAVLAGARA